MATSSSPVEAEIIEALSGGEVIQRDIPEAIDRSRSCVSSYLTRMEEQGIVERQVSKENNGSKRVSLVQHDPDFEGIRAILEPQSIEKFDAGDSSRNTTSPRDTKMRTDDFYDLLGNYKRREIIRHLDDVENDSIYVINMAEYLGTLHTGVRPESLDQDEKHRHYGSLNRTHIPRLDDHGIISYDDENKEITIGDNFTLINSLVEQEFETPEASQFIENKLVLNENVAEDVDKFLKTLSCSRRRDVIRYLQDQENSRASIADLAENIAALEEDTEPRLIHSSTRKSVYTPLMQDHLYKLDAVGIIDYDDNRGQVESGEKIELAESFVGDGFESPMTHITYQDVSGENPEFEDAIRSLLDDTYKAVYSTAYAPKID